MSAETLHPALELRVGGRAWGRPLFCPWPACRVSRLSREGAWPCVLGVLHGLLTLLRVSWSGSPSLGRQDEA